MQISFKQCKKLDQNLLKTKNFDLKVFKIKIEISIHFYSFKTNPTCMRKSVKILDSNSNFQENFIRLGTQNLDLKWFKMVEIGTRVIWAILSLERSDFLRFLLRWTNLWFCNPSIDWNKLLQIFGMIQNFLYLRNFKDIYRVVL